MLCMISLQSLFGIFMVRIKMHRSIARYKEISLHLSCISIQGLKYCFIMLNQKVQDFSDSHSLAPLKQEQEPFNGCSICKYYLHDECLEAPRSISHPSHPSHHLTLLPYQTYSSGGFICDGCGLRGKAFLYSCSLCSFNLHTHCALSPNTIVLDKHPHELQLIFDSKDRFKKITCDLCNAEVDLNNWLYYCGGCDFGTHLYCGLRDRRPSKLQIQTSNNASDSDKAQLHHPEELHKDYQSEADYKGFLDVRNDSVATTWQPQRQKCDCRVEHLSQAMDEVTEIQIMLAKLQNLLSKTCTSYRAPQV